MLHTKLRAVSEAQARLESLRRMLTLGAPAEHEYLRVTRLAQKLFNVPISYVSVLDGQTQYLMSPLGMAPMAIPCEQSLCQHVIKSKQRIVCEDASQDERFACAQPVQGAPGIRFYAAQPIHNAEGHVIGALCVADTQPRTLSDAEAQWLEDLTYLLEATIALRYLSFSHEKALVFASAAGRDAMTDALTGVFNRRGIIDMANHAYARCIHENRGFSLALVDLDHFKAINDEFGHTVGDEALKEAAQRIQRTLRGGDIIGRWGGEEFLVALPGSSPSVLQDVGNKLVQVVGGPVVVGESKVQLSASVGLVGVGTAKDVFDEVAWLEAADQALYMAKERGRAQAVVYPSAPG
ncbi:MAG: sensor domain-containing diguanylate cyclase [Paludibacterium sp.]|uniref:sensor domain-containing diguanylate cyclase n=1 Tax=Paludibacterium sp. TaxID=1917523 RepID=UPI0025DA0191|nr:sensor domain-containing diguanylate cyclase [Paludibacterium sp.]MBV8048421.1 sensor domain-containing diguanylate cyclase [Paludibacterium sp.]MBV8646907.1 sensor domain-containing diguanylate cyclase [Paludibacterium sp.]